VAVASVVLVVIYLFGIADQDKSFRKKTASSDVTSSSDESGRPPTHGPEGFVDSSGSPISWANYQLWAQSFNKPSISDEILNTYLENERRQPEALVFALMISWDPILWEELKRHKNDSIAAEYIAIKTTNPSERLIWAERLKALEPDNALGSLLRASALREMNRDAEARSELETITDNQSETHIAQDLIDRQLGKIETIAGNEKTDIQGLKLNGRHTQDVAQVTSKSLEAIKVEDLDDFRLLTSLIDTMTPESLSPESRGYFLLWYQTAFQKAIRGLPKDLSGSPDVSNFRHDFQKNFDRFIDFDNRRQKLLVESWNDPEALGALAARLRTGSWEQILEY